MADYRNLQLEKIVIPAPAEEKAKAGRHWQHEAAPGILLQIEYAKDGRPAFCVNAGDKAEGLKYQVIINHADKRLDPMTKAIKKADKEASWISHIVSEIDKNPRLKTSTTAFACNTAYALYIWSSAKEEYPVLLGEISKAIAMLLPDPGAKLDSAAEKALMDEKGLAAFMKAIEKNKAALSKYQKLAAQTDALLGKWPVDKLLPFLATICYVEGFTDALKALAEKHKIARFLSDNDKAHEQLFFLLQEKLGDQYSAGKKGYYAKEPLIGFIRLFANAFRVFGYALHPKGIETLIRVFENDAVEGVSYALYKSATEYKAEDFGYYDSMENEEYYRKLWSEIDVNSYMG